jgi:hypothetical protein
MLSGVDWIQLVPEMVRWRTLVSTVMNIWVSKRAGILNQLHNCQFLMKGSAPQICIHQEDNCIPTSTVECHGKQVNAARSVTDPGLDI